MNTSTYASNWILNDFLSQDVSGGWTAEVQAAPGGGTLLVGAPTDPAASNPSTDPSHGNLKTDEDEVEDDSDDERAAEEQWQSIVDHIRNNEADTESHHNLVHYEKALARRNTANERLEQVFLQTQEALQKIVEKTVQIIVPIFDAIEARLEQQQDDIVSTMLSNH